MRTAKKPGWRPATAFEMLSYLQSVDAGPSEWYTYTYLAALAEAAHSQTFRTTMTTLREGTRNVKGIRLAINTVKASIERLEADGLISVQRTPQGITMHLDITIL